MCRVDFSAAALAQLRKLDKAIAQRFLDKLKWLSVHFDEIEPEGLVGNWANAFKLRVGAYRVTYSANRSERVLVVLPIGHRREVYQLPRN